MMSHEVFPRERFHIEVAGNALGRYQFGAETVTHYFCRNCGIYPFHESSRKPGYRVNLGCVGGLDTFAFDTDLFDGKSLP